MMLGAKLLLIVVAIYVGLLIIETTGHGHDDCVRSWKKIGCFKDKKGHKNKLRALKEILITDRDSTMKSYSGKNIDWQFWRPYLLDLACRCAQATRDKGYTMFGMQFFGECWSGPDAESRYDMYGESTDCYEELQNPLEYNCINSDESECVGGNHANYIYQLEEIPRSVDGGFSEWSSWSDCSVTCGTGVQTRKRTCTNPPPQLFGLDCFNIGEYEETKGCQTVSC